MTNDNNWPEDSVRHGIDNDPHNDAEKGATLGGIGGAVTGAAAGSMVGPAGAIAGAVIGGIVGGVASGAAVGAIDRHDNDNTVSGLGHTNRDAADFDNNRDIDSDIDDDIDNLDYADNADYPVTGTEYNLDNGSVNNPIYGNRHSVGNGVPGIQTGGHDIDGTPDTRGITEKAADKLTGDRIDDKTGKPIVP